MEITGTIHHVGELVKITDSFSERRIVVKTEEQYSQPIEIQFVNRKCDTELDSLVFGKRVKVYINLRGREWINPQGEVKYFNTIQGWKVEQL